MASALGAEYSFQAVPTPVLPKVGGHMRIAILSIWIDPYEPFGVVLRAGCGLVDTLCHPFIPTLALTHNTNETYSKTKIQLVVATKDDVIKRRTD